MKLFLSALILILSFQLWAKADDINEFEIEGFSVGESLVKYLDQKEITKRTIKHLFTIQIVNSFQ